jgi:hypothetical protein
MTPAARGSSASVRRYVAAETGISMVLNSIVSAGFVWLVFGGLSVISLWGPRGMAFDLVPTTFMITLMCTLGLTLVMRVRLRQARAPRLPAEACAVACTWLPRNVCFRALTLAMLATFSLVPLTVSGMLVLQIHSASYTHVMLFKILYGAMLAALITPIIILRAMAERS